MSLRLKTILGVALIEAVLLAILLTLTINYLQKTNYEGLDHRASSTVTLFSSTIKNAVLSYDLATVDSFTEELLGNKDVLYVIVYGEGGQLLSSQGKLPKQISTEILESSSDLVLDGIYDVKAPIEESGINFGSVWLGFDMNRINSQIDEAKKWSIFIVIGEMILVALFSYALGLYLTRRLSELKKAADIIATGSREITFNIQGRDELATVSYAFENMVEQLKDSESQMKQYQQELELANKLLESKVQERTRELQTSNNELIATNNKLKSTQAKLVESEKMASIGTMAAGVAHEINNPMGIVSCNLQMCHSYLQQYQDWIQKMQDELKQQDSNFDYQPIEEWQNVNQIEFLDEDFKDSLLDATNGAERVQKIVKALEHYSVQNIENRGGLTPINFANILADVINAIKLPENINLTVMPSVSELPLINGVVSDINVLINEIIKNAIQACQRNIIEDNKQIKVAAKQLQNSIVIQFFDTGDGINDNSLRRVFDPFFTTLKTGEGMGLGLTYAYDIMRFHQGKIQLKNLETGGASVTLSFPLIENS